MMMIRRSRRSRSGAPRGARRGFNLVELLMALSISAALLTATMVAMDASFTAYQRTTEQASTHTIGRLTMHRILTMIRSGEVFRPLPTSPLDLVVESEFIEIELFEGADPILIEWVPDDEALYYEVNGERNLLLEGVIEQIDPDTGDVVPPFTLEFETGTEMYRCTIDLAIVPDDNMDVQLDGDWEEIIRLVATAMPRGSAYD